MFLRLLCGIAVTLTLVALARILHEKMLVQQRRKEKRGHFCVRLYANNLVSISDLKRLNRAWYNVHARRPDYDLLLDAYDKQFYKVKSSNVHFPSAAKAAKKIIQRVDEDEHYDPLVDFMLLFKHSVKGADSILNPEARAQWDRFWKQHDADN